MNASFESALTEVAAVPGVRAVLLASEREGLALNAMAAFGVDGDALAAFGTALYRRARLASEAAGYGATRQIVLDATGGRMLVTGCGDLVLVVLAERETGAGMVRMAMQRAARAVR
ncbi:MAG TPA: roadblock/LC7 domain-containing protein [Gemmatimonadaceae bacterium]